MRTTSNTITSEVFRASTPWVANLTEACRNGNALSFFMSRCPYTMKIYHHTYIAVYCSWSIPCLWFVYDHRNNCSNMQRSFVYILLFLLCYSYFFYLTMNLQFDVELWPISGISPRWKGTPMKINSCSIHAQAGPDYLALRQDTATVHYPQLWQVTTSYLLRLTVAKLIYIYLRKLCIIYLNVL